MHWRIFSVLAAAVFFSSCFNQNADSSILSQSYIHKYGFEVSKTEWKERNENGKIITAYADGSSETNSYENGILHGVCTLTYPQNQKVKETSEYNKGILYKKTFFNPEGFPMREELYETDKTILTLWDKKGVPLAKEEYQEGKLIKGHYFNSSNILESSIANGKGTRVKRDENGNLLYKELFEDGTLATRTNFHPNGKAETISHFKDYQLHGQQTTFSPSGSLIREAYWQNGQLHGKETCYRNGRKFLEVAYNNGQKDGVEKEYYQGYLVREVPWKNGLKHGMERIRYRDYTDIHWYFNGKIVDLAKYKQLNEREQMLADLEKSKHWLDSKNIR